MRSFHNVTLRPLSGICSRNFRSNETGSIAVIFALVLTPLLILCGFAVDYSRWHAARSRTESAIDAAVVAGARTLQTNGHNQGAALQTARAYYDAAVKGRTELLSDTVSFQLTDGNSVQAIGNAKIATQFLPFIGIASLNVVSLTKTNGPKATISRGADANSKLEIAMMLDVTGSMAGSRIAALKTAASSVVDILLSGSQDSKSARIAIIPYAAGVNAGTFATTARGTVSSGVCSTPGCQQYNFINALGARRTLPATSCVSERTGTHAFNDQGPQVAKVGYSYLPTGNVCPIVPVMPLTSDKNLINASISALTAGGSSASQIGFAWTWYTLSPNWASVFVSGAPGNYNDKNVQKIAIIMTDGEFNSPYCNGTIAKDATYGSGSAADHTNCNSPNGSSYVQATRFCEQMKTSGIEVYTVAFELIDSRDARQVMQTCASDSAKAYDARGEEQLLVAFRDIAMKLSTIYLAQ